MTQEELDLEALNWTNKYFGPEEDRREDMEIKMSDVDNAFIAGAKWEASRHNSKCENLAQTLQAFRDAVSREWTLSTKMIHLVAMVDQCLLENKPETIVP